MDDIIYVTCPSRDTQELTLELEEWFIGSPQVAKVVHYGITQKERQGFLFLRVLGGIPTRFLEKLKNDRDIFDVVVCPRSTFTQE